MGDVKAFKALSMLHFHGREEEDELIKNANINCFFNEVNLKTNCELYRKYYHIDKLCRNEAIHTMLCQYWRGWY